MGQTWRQTELDTLTKLIDLAWSARQIAEAMGKTRNSVLGICHRQRLQLARSHGNSAGIGLRRETPSVRRPSAKKVILRIEPPAIANPCEPKSLEVLEASECHWAVSDNPRFLFCAMPVSEKGYCEHHAFVAHNRVNEQQKNKESTAA